VRIRSVLLYVLVPALLVAAVVGLVVLGKRKAEGRARADLSLAEHFFENGEFEKARELYKTVANKGVIAECSESALGRLGEICEQNNDSAGAMAHWQRLLDEYPEGARVPEATYHLGLCYETQGDAEAARTHYTRVRRDVVYASRALCGLGRLKEAGGDLEEARSSYREALERAAKGSEARKAAEKLLGDINVRLIFSSRKTEDAELYTVKQGDSVSSIGDKFNTTQALILKANGIANPSGLRINRTLKITPKQFRILIDLSEFSLTLLDGDRFFKKYLIGIGRPERPTTPGEYLIKTKQVNPTWYSPHGKVYPPLDPENELGTRWMGLEPAAEGLPTDLGIHGTIDPSTVGKASSRGCPRMYPAEAEQLFDLVTLGTHVTIQE